MLPAMQRLAGPRSIRIELQKLIPSRLKLRQPSVHTILILTVKCGDESRRDGLQPDCLGSPRSRPVQARLALLPTPRILLYPPALDASTLRTSDWDMPNCRAMSLGLIPALNAARNGIDLPARQREWRRFNLPPEGRFVRSRRAVRGLIGRR